MEVQEIKTYVFFDLETTGLPCIEHNKTKIVELCFTAVQADFIILGSIPRILPKLNLCFNPQKLVQPGATCASGLTNELLENQPKFDGDIAIILQNFLNLQRKPVCFVAHNGNKFDYPILRTELHKIGANLSEDILCVDSLIAFRQLYNEDVEKQRVRAQNVASDTVIEFEDNEFKLFQVLDELKNSTEDLLPMEYKQKPLNIEEIKKRNETTPKKTIVKRLYGNRQGVVKQMDFGKLVSFKLSDLYKLLTQKIPTDAHKAEYDVFMLIACVAKLGQRFTKWADLNALRFCNIPIMRPGKYIGTN